MLPLSLIEVLLQSGFRTAVLAGWPPHQRPGKNLGVFLFVF